MTCWALVPVKARGAGKRRLAGALDEESRAALVQAMLEHVLAALRRCAPIQRIAVMTPEQDILPRDVQWIGDAAEEVNQSLRAALELLTVRGATRVAVVSADLPFVTAEELGSLLTASEAAGIALAPDRHGSGTNAVALALPSNFHLHFGPGSLARHATESARFGIAPAILRLPGLEFDLDDADDLTLLRERADPRYTLRR